MADQKIYAGVKLRETRLREGRTQKAFAQELGISLSYLNQMENNHRPLSAAVMLGLVQKFGFDVTQLSVDEAARMVVDMREALADPVFGDHAPPNADLQLMASNAPMLAHAFLELHRAYKRGHEQLASLDEAIAREGSGLAPLPWEEVRDFFHYCDNYIDSVDRAAERFAKQAGFSGSGKIVAASDWLKGRHGVDVVIEWDAPLRGYDAEAKVLRLSARARPETLAFQLAHQTALLDHMELLEATLDLARFRTEEARQIALVGLANHFAGAAVLPYGAFLEAAQETRHDLDQLAHRFGASVEQVAHRLSTLQRPGAKGVPFFFVRVDQGGTITKRHSATRLQFARFGGACPLWNVHRAFEAPGQTLCQLAQTPDGVRYFCLARDISKPAQGYGAPRPRYAMGLGCEVAHAGALVYADDFDLEDNATFEPIGISCRICERENCHQRAVPPLERALKIDPNARGLLPYRLA